MADILLLLLGVILVNNVVFTQYLGLCPFMGVGGRLETALGMSALTILVLTLASIFNYLLYHYLLLPFDLTFLRTIVFLVVIATLVNFVEMLVHKVAPLLHQRLGIFLPLITANSAILGVILLSTDHANDFLEAVLFGCGAAVGFSLALVLFAALRERLAMSEVPMPFQGSAITLITAGLMALAFMGFSALV
jgi:electron transport complex protein RnfA